MALLDVGIHFNPLVHYRGNPCKHGHEGIRFVANSACAHCTKARTLAKYADNKAKWRERGKKWHKENTEGSRAIAQRYRDSHPWMSKYYNGRRRAFIIRATPSWADFEKIKAIYENCPEGHQVDHIVPLNSKLVCGLHWEGNLQYLPAADNVVKGNRFWPDMP